MPFLDIFRNLFGIRNNQEDHPSFVPEIPRQENDSFRNPIWETEDDDDDYNGDFRQSNGGGIHFILFRDPFEMRHHFESQVNGFLQNFIEGLTGQRGFFMHQFNDESPLESGIPALPQSPERPEKNLRDHILEREFDHSQNYSHELPKADSDLDGKITAGDLSKSLKKNSWMKFSGSTSSTKIVRRGDGAIEKCQTFEDSNGNRKTIITRQIGDKMHEIITERDKEGIETQTENLINIDENELNNFDSKWKSRIVQNPQINSNPDKSNFPWHTFFGPEPKL